jgi:predicted MFS family arabinose efflux permease
MLGAASLDARRDKRWLILLVLFIARAAIAFQFQSIPALSPLLVDSLQIDYALLGTLVGLYMLPGVVFSLPGGVLGQRFGDKEIALVGLGLMALGGLWVALSGTYLSASFGRVVGGVGAVLLNIVLAKMVTDWFAGREIVRAMALFVSSWPVGIGLGLLVLPILATTTSARATTSAVTWAILLSLPLGGYLAERLKSPDRVMIGCFVLLAALITALPLGAFVAALSCA